MKRFLVELDNGDNAILSQNEIDLINQKSGNKLAIIKEVN